jgi:hypothetical protein
MRMLSAVDTKSAYSRLVGKNSNAKDGQETATKVRGGIRLLEAYMADGVRD